MFAVIKYSSGDNSWLIKSPNDSSIVVDSIEVFSSASSRYFSKSDTTNFISVSTFSGIK